MAVEMPRACFDEKDHLNHRYFARRAQYLGELAAALRKSPSFRQLSWEFLGHDARYGFDESLPAADYRLGHKDFVFCIHEALHHIQVAAQYKR